MGSPGIIAATNCDLEELTYHFVQDCAIQYGKPVPKIDPELMAALVNYDWPGNIRELRNVIERLVILAEGNELRRSDLPEDIRVPHGEGSALRVAEPNNLSLIHISEPTRPY